MSTPKRFWDILPLHYWTGILGGVIYLLWIVITPHVQYDGRNFLVLIMFAMIQMPTFLYLILSESLIPNLNPSSWLVNTAPLVAYIIPYIVFVLAGIIAGKTSKDPRRETFRRRIMVVLFGTAITVCACLAAWFVFIFDDL
jgi:hypothetical protein